MVSCDPVCSDLVIYSLVDHKALFSQYMTNRKTFTNLSII